MQIFLSRFLNDANDANYLNYKHGLLQTCHCRRWQIRGIPCIHALFFMSVIAGAGGEVDQYVSEYFSVANLGLHML
jgi:hypothetical protein